MIKNQKVFISNETGCIYTMGSKDIQNDNNVYVLQEAIQGYRVICPVEAFESGYTLFGYKEEGNNKFNDIEVI